MDFAQRFERAFRYLLPAPFSIAVVLTVITLALALFMGHGPATALSYWYEGLWNAPLLVFAVQMMLILVLGHSLALAPVVSRFIGRIVQLADNPVRATALTCFFTLLVSFFNWGLGLVFGALLARKTGERFSREKKPVNYALIGAAGYSGLMVWHGGLSGSAPIKVAEKGHLASLMGDVWPAAQRDLLPAAIHFGDTVFSPMNLTASALLLVLLPGLLALLARYAPRQEPKLRISELRQGIARADLRGAERLDHSRWSGRLLAAFMLAYAIYRIFNAPSGWGFLDLNFVNFSLLGLGLFFHGSFHRFVKAVEEAITGAAAILIQFPLYFGIMGVMTSSGLIGQISGFFSQYASAQSFPLITFFSAGLVNIFVPSGGGQWAVQGPIIIETARQMDIPLAKCIMALAYGDQVTNMLQPFWALPLLAITGLKAREILPYTLLLLLAGSAIFVAILILF